MKTYWNNRTKRYEVDEKGTIHVGTIVDELAKYEHEAQYGFRIRDMIKEVGENTKAHGFRDKKLSPSDFIALIHSELSETLEEFREGREATETYYTCDSKLSKSQCDLEAIPDLECNGCEHAKPEGVPAELADVVIRCFDMADYYGIDLQTAIINKNNFNKKRPYMHDKKF